MKRFVNMLLGLSIISSAAFAADEKAPKIKPKTHAGPGVAKAESKPKVEVKSEFAVQDIPKPEPIEGQLGEPGAPSLKEQQELLAKSLLARGLCNESYYGAEFCEKQAKRTFKVNDQLGTLTPDSETLGDRSEEF